MHHSVLGNLTFDEGIWSGEIEQAGAAIGFAIAGDATEPDSQQLRRLLQHLEAYEDLQARTFSFIDDQLRHNHAGDSSLFTIRSLDFLWPKQEDYFMIWLELEGDEWGAWKVEFLDGQPKHLSRDD